MGDNADEKFSVTLEGHGITIDKKVDRQTAMAVMATIMGGPAPQRCVTSTGGASVPVSLREFLTQIAPSTHKERIVSIGLYYRKYNKKSTFSKNDIELGYRKAHESLPKNVYRDIDSTIKAGWMDETEDKGIYYITNTGENAVMKTLPPSYK